MKRSKFNLSHYRLLTCNQGDLVPCTLVEVLPGDSIQHATSILIRTQPLVVPPMHPVHIRVHHWFVPFRLIWQDWEAFITGGSTPDSPPTFPTVANTRTNNTGDLGDHLGLPCNTGTVVATVNVLPYRAYQLIYNEFYRDQDLVTPSVISKASGTDTTTDLTMKKVAWEKDYFTSARPWAQKGSAVTLPLGTTAPVERVSNAPAWKGYRAGTDTVDTDNAAGIKLDGSGLLNDSTHQLSFDPMSGLQVNLSGATAATVNDIRLAMALQRYAEARARYGSRYTEYLRYLGVRSSDARLQRPEYLGGGKHTLQFSEVVQTASSGDAGVEHSVGVTGSIRGHGIAAGRSNRYRRFFEEHGYIMSLISVLPRTMYYQGLPRLWNRRTREDFFQKELQHVGQQEIKGKELFLAGDSGDEATWGFQDRYDEYRRMENSVSGEFRQLENYWHLGREFGSLPTLNGSFVSSNPTDRPFSEFQDELGQAPNQLKVMAYHSMQARRLLAPKGTSFIS